MPQVRSPRCPNPNGEIDIHRSFGSRSLAWCAPVGKIPDVAREFGCTSWTIWRWIKKQSDQQPSASQGELSASVRQELLRLRQENRQLKSERELLSKAVAWFAQEKSGK